MILDCLIYFHVIGDLTNNCDLFIIVGTSSIVYPAAMFAPLVVEMGKPVAEFNLSEFPASESFR